jgi:hypothetical protein
VGADWARAVGGSPFTGGGLKGPAGIARDIEGNAWVANNALGANSISEILMGTDDHPTGMPLSPPGGFSGAAQPSCFTVNNFRWS